MPEYYGHVSKITYLREDVRTALDRIHWMDQVKLGSTVFMKLRPMI